jgi:hypothetical protein
MMFYCLEIDEKFQTVWYNEDAPNPFESIYCPKDESHRSSRRMDCSLNLDFKSKKKADIYMTSYSDWIITDRVAEIFKKHNLTGYELREVKYRGIELSDILWELVITGTAGEPHPDCGMYVTRKLECCNHTYYRLFKDSTGIIVNENNWDGNDFFTVVPLPKYTLCTEKVKEIIKEYKFKGVIVVPTTEISKYRPHGEDNRGECCPF